MLHLEFEGNADDASDSGLDGNIIGIVGYEPGVIGDAIKLGGLSSPGQIRVPADASLSFTNEITVSYWLKVNNQTGTNGNGNQVDKGIHAIFEGSEVSNLLFTEAGNSTFYYPAPVNFRLQVGGITDVGQWVHVAYVVSAGSSVSYLNGSQYAENIESAPIDLRTSSGFYIGRQKDNWYPLDGSLDDFRIYNRALTSEEIQELFDLGS